MEALAKACRAASTSSSAQAARLRQLQHSMSKLLAARYGQTSVTFASGGVVAAGGAVSTREEFSAEDLPLSIGSLFGVRYWTVPKVEEDRDVIFHKAGSLWVPVTSNVAPAQVRLQGAQAAWAPGENVASCTAWAGGRGAHAPEKIPVRSCGCGFWVYWDPSAAVPGIAHPDVAGVVEGWGRYIGGTKGFRCQKVRVVALTVLDPPATWRSLSAYSRSAPAAAGQRDPNWRTAMEQALAEIYQVPMFSSVDTMLKAFPPSRGDAAAKAEERLAALEARTRYHPQGPAVAPGQIVHPTPVPQNLTACVVCGDPPLPGSAMCSGCEVMANLAAKNMTLIRCACGLSHAVTAQAAEVTVVCACERRHVVPPPGISPHQALAELKQRAAKWVQPLKERRRDAWLRCQQLAYAVAYEERAITLAESNELALLMAMIEELDKRIRQRLLSAERLLAHFSGAAQPGGSPRA